MRRFIPFNAILACVIIFAGCRTPEVFGPPEDADMAPELVTAQSLYNEGKYTEAITECIRLARMDPLMPGLSNLQRNIMERLAEKRRKAMENRVATSAERMSIDSDERKALPGTYGLRRHVKGEEGSLRTQPTNMEDALSRPVTVHLDNVSLDDFILAIGASDNINIIADTMETETTMTVHADNVPLSEILDYVSRNLGISFSIGKSIIWATPSEETTEPGLPMETRMYRLRRGLSSTELGTGGEDSGPGEVNVVATIERFVPQPDGSDIMFDQKVHVLIVKNLKHNLTLVEDIIEALDVTPPQVLIEARFISTSISDLRELGIDWVLNSNMGVTSKTVLENGKLVRRDSTLVEEGAKIGFAPFANEAQGLNFTYQGILTDPMFQAVLHALDTSGKARTLSVPKVATVNNREAKIRIGEDFRYFEEYDVQSIPGRVSDNNSTTYDSVLVPVGSPTLEELGIELTVTPSVGADLRTITLNLAPEISAFKEWVEYEVASRNSSNYNNSDNDNNTDSNTSTNDNTSLVKLPIFTRSEIETEVLVQSGETVAMGGLITSVENRIDNSVPFLSSIPIIGRLFRHENIEESKDNLLIFVTATLLSERGESLIPLEEKQQPPGEQ